MPWTYRILKANLQVLIKYHQWLRAPYLHLRFPDDKDKSTPIWVWNLTFLQLHMYQCVLSPVVEVKNTPERQCGPRFYQIKRSKLIQDNKENLLFLGGMLGLLVSWTLLSLTVYSGIVMVLIYTVLLLFWFTMVALSLFHCMMTIRLQAMDWTYETALRMKAEDSGQDLWSSSGAEEPEVSLGAPRARRRM